METTGGRTLQVRLILLRHSTRNFTNCHRCHYDDVIMTMLASQITSLMVVYSIVYSVVNQREHQSSASLAFVREIHRGPVNFPHKWPVTRKMFPFDDVIMVLFKYPPTQVLSHDDISDRRLYKTSIVQIASGATAMGGRTLQIIANVINTIFGHVLKGVTLVCHWYLLGW